MATAIALLLLSGLVALAVRRGSGRLLSFVPLAAALLAVPDIVAALRGGAVALLGAPGSLYAAGLDPLSGFFAMLIFCIAIPAAIHGGARGGGAQRGSPGEPGGARPGSISPFFPLLVGALLTVVIARSALLFLMGWEAMTIAAFFLVAEEHERLEQRRAGLRFLAASQLGGLCLFALFALLAADADSLAFDDLAVAGAAAGPLRGGILFLLALVGFGTKAGLLPFHVWLPEAYPAARSHSSALLAGVMGKVGWYGFLRVLMMLGDPAYAEGLVLLALGGASAIVGIASSLGQRDVKRVLAYSSVENMGIAAIGLGIALLAIPFRLSAVAGLAMTGTLLHLLHHMVAKGLLFLSAGTAERSAGTRNLEETGGLSRRAPHASASFLAGGAALAALPPLGGLLGEWLILSGGFLAIGQLPIVPALVVLLALLALVGAGGLAAASFARVFAVLFLGRERAPVGEAAREVPLREVVPVLSLAILSLLIGIFPADAVRLVGPAAAFLLGPSDLASDLPHSSLAAVEGIARVCCALLAVCAALTLLRTLLRRRATLPAVDTWGCGFARPTARLQYTATSFAGPLLRTFGSILAPTNSEKGPGGAFPSRVGRETRVQDRLLHGFYLPLFRAIAARLGAMRRWHRGSVHGSILAIIAALLLGLLWVVVSRWVLPS